MPTSDFNIKDNDVQRYLSQRVQEEIIPLTEVLIEKAKGGDLRAMNMLFERSLGRVRQGNRQLSSVGEIEMAVSPEAVKLAHQMNALYKKGLVTFE